MNFDALVAELSAVDAWENLVPDYDEDSLMVHWSNTSSSQSSFIDLLC